MYGEDLTTRGAEDMLDCIQRPSEREIAEVLAKKDNASDLYYIGRSILHRARYHADRKTQKYRALEYMTEAACLGHVCGAYMTSSMVEKKDPEIGREMMTRAAEMGSGAAAYKVATPLYKQHKYREAGSFDALGTMFGCSRCEARLCYYREEIPFSIAPFGEWEPKCVVHIRVPNVIHRAMVTACLIFWSAS